MNIASILNFKFQGIIKALIKFKAIQGFALNVQALVIVLWLLLRPRRPFLVVCPVLYVPRRLFYYALLKPSLTLGQSLRKDLHHPWLSLVKNRHLSLAHCCGSKHSN